MSLPLEAGSDLKMDETEPGVISHIPNEIIAQIFMAGTEIWREMHHLALPFPMLVSSVCSHWRELALATPSLWTVIIPPLRRGKDDAVCLQWISEWCDRSKALPVSVILDTRWYSYYSSSLYFTIYKLFHFVVRNVERVRRLDIGPAHLSGMAPVSTNFVQEQVLKASNLEQISLCLRQVPVTSFGHETKWDWLRDLPMLKKLRIDGVQIPFVSNLTSLEAHRLRLTYHDAENIFIASPLLTNLVLHNLLPLEQLPPVPHDHIPIQANSLRSIIIKSCETNDADRFYLFNLLIIPNLQYLEIEGIVCGFEVFGNSLASSKIETLRLSEHTQLFYRSNPAESIRDIGFYHSFTSLRNLQLIRGPSAQLLTKMNGTERDHKRPLRPSISLSNLAKCPDLDFQTPKNKRTTPQMPWPELRVIFLDSLLSSDLVGLINFLKLHGKVQTVELSSLAMRHLSQSLLREGDNIFPVPSRYLTSRFDDTSDNASKDVSEWLGRLVDLKSFGPAYTRRSKVYLNHSPLSEMI